MDVFFRLNYTARDFWMTPEGPVKFNFGGIHEVVVEVSTPSPADQDRGHKRENAHCTAQLKMPVNERNEAVFAAIEANAVVPEGSEEVGAEYDGPDGKRIQIPALARFPEHFRGFVSSAHDELKDYTRRTVLVMRWRMDSAGPHDPFSTRGMEWSRDGRFWHFAPSNTSVRGEVRGGLRVSDPILEQVHQLVVDGRSEPLDHQMLREAWNQRYENPRSALVIGMAALELGVKRCIGTLVPDAEWLASYAPTPPLVQILTDYLPKLPAKGRFGGAVKAPPEDILKVLKKAVVARNQLVHAGSTKPTGDDVDPVLQAVRDVLWLLDFYNGSAWALEHLRADTRGALGPPDPAS